MEKLPSGRYAMHLRKSREDVEAERAGWHETLSLHRAELRRLANHYGIEIGEEDVFEEIMSGDSLGERPECRRLLELVKRGTYRGVLDIDIQRLTRGDLIDQGIITNVFRYSKTLIVTPGKVYDLTTDEDTELVEMRMSFGRRELSMIKKRLVAGKERHVMGGEYIGPIAPFGWRKVVVNRKKTLEPSSDNETLVQWYEDIAAKRATCSSISLDLNRRGVPSPRGGYWDEKTIKSIIRNPVNIGFVRWNQKKTVTEFDENGDRVRVRREPEQPILVKGIHDGTVSEELFNAANSVLNERSLKGHYGRELKNPLASLLRCRGCGRAMGRVTTQSSYRVGVVHSKSNRCDCWMMGSSLRTVMYLLADRLEDIAERMEWTVMTGGDSKGFLKLRVEDLKDSVHGCLKSQDNLFRLAEKGLITDDEFSRRKEMLDSELGEAQEELERAVRELRRAPDLSNRAATVRKAVSMTRRYDEYPARQVNELLKSFIERIEYEKDPQTRRMRLEVLLK